MSKFILGSGLVGLIAKEILGNDWEIIPQGRSRYYSFEPALSDNHIVATEAVKQIINAGQGIREYKKAFSLGGHLLWEPHDWALDMYSNKLYGESNGIFKKIFNSKVEIFGLKCNELYKILMNKHIQDIKKANAKYGQIKEISNEHIHTTTGKFPYQRVLSTIPLDVLFKFLKIENDLKSRDVWVYRIETDQLDFEGADEVLVLDQVFDFYKSVMLSKNEYQFFCLNEIKTPLEYFGAFTNNRLTFNPRHSTKIPGAIPMGGGPPDLSELKKYNIECMGSNALWDDMVDISACIIRILKMKN